MKYGLTDERYLQMMRFYGNDEEEVAEVVKEWGAENCNKGYSIFDYDCTGMLEIEAIMDVNAFDDEEACKKALADGIKIIPVSELPENMPGDMRFFGWIDTADNRKRIAEFCRNVI